MKKVTALFAALICILSFCGCSLPQALKTVKVDYGTSADYTREDMDKAIEIIKSEIEGWEGCKLNSISYTSDEEGRKELGRMNELEKANDNEQTFTQCIVFSSDFHTSKKDSEGFNSDYAYRDWKWFFARSDSGEWKLMTWGY